MTPSSSASRGARALRYPIRVLRTFPAHSHKCVHNHRSGSVANSCLVGLLWADLASPKTLITNRSKAPNVSWGIITPGAYLLDSDLPLNGLPQGQFLSFRSSNEPFQLCIINTKLFEFFVVINTNSVVMLTRIVIREIGTSTSLHANSTVSRRPSNPSQRSSNRTMSLVE